MYPTGIGRDTHSKCVDLTTIKIDDRVARRMVTELCLLLKYKTGHKYKRKNKTSFLIIPFVVDFQQIRIQPLSTILSEASSNPGYRSGKKHLSNAKISHGLSWKQRMQVCRAVLGNGRGEKLSDEGKVGMVFFFCVPSPHFVTKGVFSSNQFATRWCNLL